MRFRIASLCVSLGFGFVVAQQASAQVGETAHERLRPTAGAEDPIATTFVLPQAESSDDRAVYIVDDFEDGNINGWSGEGSQDCSGFISTEAPFGSFSMAIDGACFPFNGYSFDVGNAAPTDVYLYVRSATTTTTDTFFVLGENLHEVVTFKGMQGDWAVYDGANHSCGPRTPNQWYYVHFVIDWSCKVFDVYIDGQLKLTNVMFYDSTVSGISRIHLFNYDVTTAWYDEIYFGTPGVSTMIFSDDFERAATCHWSSVVN